MQRRPSAYLGPFPFYSQTNSSEGRYALNHTLQVDLHRCFIVRHLYKCILACSPDVCQLQGIDFIFSLHGCRWKQLANEGCCNLLSLLIGNNKLQHLFCPIISRNMVVFLVKQWSIWIFFAFKQTWDLSLLFFNPFLTKTFTFWVYGDASYVFCDLSMIWTLNRSLGF